MIDYEAKCPCGNNITIQVEENTTLLRVRCKTCNRLLVDYNASQTQNPLHMVKSITSVDIGADAPPQKREMEKVDGYSLLKCLAKGVMGDVYLAVHEKSQEKVALKLLQKTKDAQILDHFLREAQILSELDHPTIVRLKDQGNHRGHPYIVMEYLPGITLQELLIKGPLHYLEAAKIVYYVLSALEYAAKYQIIHRDIKPENIIISNKGEVKLIDLGIGKILNASMNVTNTGEVMGTPYYMPLEQISATKDAGYQADVYAVGATLHHALSGSAPFSEHGNNVQKLFNAKIRNEYVQLQEKKPNLPREIIKITEKAMAHETQNRYRNAREMKEAISAFYKFYAKKPK